MNKLSRISLISLFALSLLGQAEINSQNTKPRVIVMTDGEIDDRSSMIRFLLYTNDVELLAIIETNSVYQREGHSKKDWYDNQIDAYEQAYPNLIIHDPQYPVLMRSGIKVMLGMRILIILWWIGIRLPAGPVLRSGLNRMIGLILPGSDKIVDVLLDENPRPVYLQAWGGGNTAARAFYKLQTAFPEEYDRAVSKAVMHNIWYQDGAGNYIEKYHPKVTLLLDHYFDGSWDYGSQSYTHSFIENEVKNNHGPLGALYPQSYVSEGDSPAFLWAIENGLRNHEDPTYGGWGGRFYKVDGFQNVYADVSEGSYTRWIEDANRDFQVRMDWCVTDKFENANHKPIINIDEDQDRVVMSGETVTLNAEGSTDPDEDRISFRWWQYQEAGTCRKMVWIDNPQKSKISFVAPDVEEICTIHLILEVKDNGKPVLTSFNRFIVTIKP